MKTKAKRFSHKLLALFLAIVMGVTCFSGALSAFAASSHAKYHDDDVEYNDLAWNILSDEQTAAALLDYADKMLADFGPKIDNLLKGALPTSGLYYYDAKNRAIGLNAAGIIKATILVRTHSVDELLETLESVASVISKYGNFLGDAGNIQLSSTNGMRRSNTSACDIIRGVLGILQKNSADYNGKDVLGQFLRGGFGLGTVGNLAKLDIYDMLQGALGLDDGYESNFVYNIVQSLIFNNTNWFTDAEKTAYKNNPSSFVFDEVLLQKMTTELLDKINILVTYPDGTSSKSRRAEINALMDKGSSYADAARSLGYDPNLVYSEENTGNILLFAYGSEKIQLTTSDSLFAFGYKALEMAWKTVLKDTVKLLHVNYDVDRGHGSNFDNQYYYWASEKFTWNQKNLAAMYSQSNINAWAQDVYQAYGASSADEFLGWVKHNFEFDRDIAEDAKGTWEDIDETTLFNKLRYSPLADYGFNMQTGPINLYFLQTGTANLDTFFDDNYGKYTSLVGGLNDALVAAVKDIFVDRANIYKDKAGDTSLPTMETVNPSTIDASAIKSITNALVSNALKIVQYTADTTDKNILNGFYKSGGKTLTEQNLEGAMLPLLIACIGQINLGSGKLERVIHPEDWNGCKDAEAVVFVLLREYLSYILPDKDYNSLAIFTSDGTIKATLEGTILPMARDAIVFVMEGSVPVTGTDGERWQVEKKPVNDENTIFDLLNSVICYYADDYDMGKVGRSMGVASLLGVCDTNGNSKINTSNTIWKNIDLIANKLLPVAGTLQGRGWGNFSSEKLIWQDIVLGMLDIADTSIHSDTNMGGVSNFIYQFLTIVSAEPIQKTPIVLTVYNFLKDFLNGLLGARYSGQSWTKPVPDASTSHPFDDVLQRNVLVGTNGNNVGVLQKMICNFVEFSGYGSKGVNTYPDSILRGIMFALQALNSFIPEAIDNIAEHSLKMVTAEFANDAVQGCSNGTTINSSVVITNNVTGLNNAYVDGINETSVEQLSRYYIEVTDSSLPGGDIAAPGWDYIAPGESMTLATSTRYTGNASDPSTSYEAHITYNIVYADGSPITDEDGNELFQDLEVTAYQYLTGAKSWQEVVYPADRNGMLPENLESNSAGQTMRQDGYVTYTTPAFAGGVLSVGYPEYVVLSTSNLGAVSGYQIRFRTVSNNSRTVDGLYYYDNRTVADDITGRNVSVSTANAIPVWDKTTGDLIRKERYDYSTDGGKTWQRNGVTGYTEDEVGNIYNGLNDSQKANFTRRDHVAYTMAEAINAGIIRAYHKNAVGVYEYVYLQTGSGTNYNTTLSQISMRGPADGFYINFNTINVGGNASVYSSFCAYDGSTSIPAGEYDVNLCAYNSSGPGYFNFKLVIGDDSASGSLEDKYDELSSLLSNYRASDFVSEDDIYTEAGAAFVNALAAKSIVLTPGTAMTMSDKTALTATTSTVATEYGDRAFVPFTSSDNGKTTAPYDMPVGVKAEAYLGGSTVNGVIYGGVRGVYYFDAACTMPIYSNVPLTSKEVKNGADAAGIAVIEGTGEDAGKYWLRNAPSYETEWDVETYNTPCLLKTETQATNDNGDLLYEQVQYVYRDANSEKVNSDRDWKAKFPVTTFALIPNNGSDDDNRGTITQAIDYLDYIIECVYNAINTSIAQDIFEKVSIVRNNMNSTNFDVVTYNKMVGIARTAENKYKVAITYQYEGFDEAGQPATITQTDVVPFSSYNGYVNNNGIKIINVATESTLSSVQVEEYVRLFDFYMSKVVERGYLGNQLEAEIECATGNSYKNLNAVPATYNEDGTIKTPAVVTKGAKAVTPDYGKWAADGTLVNEGPVVYSKASWNAYITALAVAIDLAKTGNGDYAHADRAYYDAADKENYVAQVTNCYTADTNLQKAEIALTPSETVQVTVGEYTGGSITIDGAPYTTPLAYEVGETITIDAQADEGFEFKYLLVNDEKVYVAEFPYELYISKDTTIVPVFQPSGYNVTGSLVIPKDAKGASTGIPVYGEYTVSLYSDAGRKSLVTEATSVYDASARTNTFKLESVPSGTYYAKITSTYSITREDITVIVSDSDINAGEIPVVPCDFDKDGVVAASDAKLVYIAAGTGALRDYCELDGDGAVGASDAKIVYIFAAGSKLPNLTIQ